MIIVVAAIQIVMMALKLLAEFEVLVQLRQQLRSELKTEILVTM